MRRVWLSAALAAMLCSAVIAQEAAPPTQGATTVVTLLHTNDFHSEFERGDALVGAIQSLRNQYPASILLDAGDFFESRSSEAMNSRGQAVVDLMNRAGYDGMTLGDNAFRGFALEDVRRCIQEFRFPVLNANLVGTGNGDPITLPYWVYHIGPACIGVIGVYGEEPLRDAGLHVIKPGAVLEYYAYHLRGKVDCIVALTHAGLEGDRKLAKTVPILDVIVGGSSNHALKEPVIEGDSIIVQAGSLGRYVGVLELTIDLDEDRVADYQGRLHSVSE